MTNSFVKKIILMVLSIAIVPSVIYILLLINMLQTFDAGRISENLETILYEKVKSIKKDLDKVESEVACLSDWAKESESLNFSNVPLPEKYIRNVHYVLEAPFEESSTFLPQNIALNDEIKEEILKTETLVSHMRSMVKNNPELAYMYIVTNSGFMRVYPYLDNKIFAPNHDQRSDPFYVIAEKSSKLSWTKPYYDYGGNGWIITCSRSYPDQSSNIGGVVCADVILSSLVKSVVDFRMGESGFSFITDESGDVIYHPYMQNIKGSMGSTFHMKYIEAYDNSFLRKSILHEMQDKASGSITFFENGKEKIIAFQRVSPLGWIMGIEISKDEYSFNESYLTIGLWIGIMLLLLLVVLIGFIISKQIAKPILQLAENVRNMDEGCLTPLPVIYDDEIGMLAHAFNNMSVKLSEYTSRLMHSKNQLESVFDSIDDTMIILDPNYKILKLNKDIHSANSLCYEALRSSNVPCKNCPIEKVKSSLLKSGGEIVYNTDIFHVTGYPIFDSNGSLKEIVIFEKRMTEQKLMEKELFQTEKLAVIGQITAGVTHELKNPLSVIKGASYLLKQTDMDSYQHDILSEIDNNIMRAEKIVYNMLDFSKSSWGEADFHDSKKLIEQIFILVRQEFIKKGISFQIMMESPNIKIYGNSDSIKNIFLNIITNAAEAMGAGDKLIITSGKFSSDFMFISFKNTGPSISEDVLNKVFEPFFTTKENGTGLGLWLVSKEIKKNGGQVKIENVADGVNVTLILPMKASARNTKGDECFEENIDG